MSAIEVDRGVGDCPERPDGFGHVWAGAIASGDARNPCRFCSYPGRGDARKGEAGFFQEATAARAELFSGLAAPKSVKVWGKS